MHTKNRMPGKRSAARFAGVALAVLMISGCESTPDDPNSGARNTGSFPNLNIKPQAAAEQLTEEERASKTASLTSTRANSINSGGAAPTNSQAELANVARTHEKRTLDEIEKNKCTVDKPC